MYSPKLHAMCSAFVSFGLAASACASPPPAHPRVWSNSIGMPFVRIPAGRFFMGSSESTEALAKSYPLMEQQRLLSLDDESPVHAVRISRAFYMGQTEVTVGQFRRFVEASGYRPESEADGTGGYGYNPGYDPGKTVRGDAFEGRDRRYSWHDPGFAQDEHHPVVNITWHDAHALAAWLSSTEGRRYRLPSEAEWEYACRAGTRTRYPHGDDPQDLVRHANTFDQDAVPYWPRWKDQALKGHDGHAFTAPVASYPANAFGLHDMVGNAWEWVSDGYAETAYAESPHDDPQGPTTSETRVRRGGSWHTWPLYARCSYRNWNTPETRYTLVGMRLVREVKTQGGLSKKARTSHAP